MRLPMILYNMKMVVVASVIMWPSNEMLVPGTPISSYKQKRGPSEQLSTNFGFRNSTNPFTVTHEINSLKGTDWIYLIFEKICEK
jgi:hypothetical protein